MKSNYWDGLGTEVKFFGFHCRVREKNLVEKTGEI